MLLLLFVCEVDSQIINDGLIEMSNRTFEYCKRKKLIFPRGKYSERYFDGVSLFPIPLCLLHGDSLVVLSDRCPYLTVISRNGQFVGLISTDDYGNCYIDLDYVYSRDGSVRGLCSLIFESKIPIFNLLGVNDQIVFTNINGVNEFLDLNEIELNMVNMEKLDVSMFKRFDVDTISNCTFLPRNPKQNSKRNLRYWGIGYGNK